MPPKPVARMLFVCLLLFAQYANGQSEKVDSLERALSRTSVDTTRLTIIRALIKCYTDSNNERTVALAKEALSLADKARSKKEAAKIYLNYASAIETVGKYTESIQYNEKALVLFKEAKDSANISIVYNNLGIGFNQIGDYSMAVHNLLLAIEIDEALKDSIGSSFDYINLSETYYFSKNYQLAERWGKKAFNTINATQEKFGLAYAAETLALAYIELGKLDTAKQLVMLAANLAKKQSVDYLICRSESHLGRINLKRGNYDSARHHFLNALKFSKDKYISDVRLPSLILLSEAYLNLGKEQMALEHALEAYQVSLAIKNKTWAMESCATLATIYEKLKDGSQAIKHLHLASLFKDTILDQSLRGSILAKAYNINLENEKRAKQKALDGLEEKDKVVLRQRNMLAIGGIAVLSLLTVLYLIRKASIERKKNNEQLINNNIQLNRLNQEVNGLINTIVHDLKAPLNSLQGILYVLEQDTNHNSSSSEMIKHGHRVVEGAHEIIKELLELRELEEKTTSLHIERVNLKQLIEGIKEEYLLYANQKQISINTLSDADVAELDQHMVKRLLGNLVSNAIKYSPPDKQVQIIVHKNNQSIIFKIVDQGQGFSDADREKMYQKFQKLSARPTAGETSHGLGLAIVKVIITRLNANIELISEVGKGSSFIITIPIA
jgi:signal transduction histidine kinase